MNPIIQTHDGHFLHLANPKPETIGIGAIAHALSNLCRFTGHVSEFYSVAQHSLMVSLVVPEEMAREGLFHDAQEAYIGDVSTPLKQLLPGYRDIEEMFESAIAERFGLRWTPEARQGVKRADRIMLATERRDLLGKMGCDTEWAILKDIAPLREVLRPMSPEHAKRAFLERARELGLTGSEGQKKEALL